MSSVPSGSIEVGADNNYFSTEMDHRTTGEADTLGRPPSLRYPIGQKTTSIVITWTVIIFTNTILPVLLFYTLRHVAHSSTNVVLNVCQIPMTATLFQVPFRLWQLKRRGGERSPRNRGLFTWDFFQWQFLLGALLVTIICVLATIMQSYKTFAAAPPAFFGEICLQLLILDAMASSMLRQPCRLSSVPKGALFRPGAYYFIEDITAVDGAGCTAYRERLAERWDASPSFRRLVRDVGRIFGFSGIFMVGIEVALILMTPEDVFFGASWFILWMWAALSAYFCVSYAKNCLRDETIKWRVAYENARCTRPL